MKRLATFLLAIFLILSHVPCCYAAEPYTIQIEFQSENSEEKYTFDNEIEFESTVYILNDVTYNVIGDDTETESIAKEYFIEKSELADKSYTFPQTKEVKDGGKTYTATFDSVEWTAKTIKGKEQIVSDRYNKGYTATMPDFPQTKTFSVTDAKTQITKTVTAPLVRTYIVEEAKWRESERQATMTFQNYTAASYNLGGGVIIPHNDACPELDDGAKVKLTEMLGYDTNLFVISKAEWNGDVYEKDGVKCRDAIVYFDTYTAKWEAYYETTTTFDKQVYDAKAKYIYTAEQSTGKHMYTILATAFYNVKAVETTAVTTTAITTTTSTATSTTTAAKPVTKQTIPTAAKAIVVSASGFSIVVGVCYIPINYIVCYDDKGRRLGSVKCRQTMCLDKLAKKVDNGVLELRLNNKIRQKIEKKIFEPRFSIGGKECAYTVGHDKIFVFFEEGRNK